MASRGQSETAKLRTNVEDQLNRLLAQLQDLEELREDIDDDEYEETKQDTLEQMKEFEATLKKMMAGDMTLISELGSVQLAIRAAISQAFKTPEVIKLFAKKDQGQLRNRLANLQRDTKLGKISRDVFTEQAVEVLSALAKLGETLSAEENSFLEENKSKSIADFESVEGNLGKQWYQRRVRGRRNNKQTTFIAWISFVFHFYPQHSLHNKHFQYYHIIYLFIFKFNNNMASRGQSETAKLRTNVEDQLNRLLAQLQDLEELREDIDDDEYEETKQDTLEQMKEFEATLKKMMAGDMTLISELGSVQLAIRAAISQAFKTPEVIKLFAKKDQGQLRNRLANLQRDTKLGKISRDVFTEQAVEVLSALAKLGETLSAEENSFLEENKSKSIADFESVEGNLGQSAQKTLLSSAAAEVKKAQK
eukprot:TRINITY_DN788_c0_g1_i1.p1 TRINITY_DN788_c0_g1~~TRINITY_DN788_c0_g1_i1.p1  ORF type:complete len:485 (-),score=142.16 TRINITY_DN788_c0_g1_i1:126-1388(-)